jgi:hypothetical protein
MFCGLLKIFKFFLGTMGVFGLFILILVTAMTITFNTKEERYTDGETPSSLFYVVLESFNPEQNRSQFGCFRWDEFKEGFQATEMPNLYICPEADICWRYPTWPDREYSAYLSVSAGSCSNLSSDFVVRNTDTFTQVVRLSWAQEAFKVRNTYRVEDQEITPLYLNKLMSAGIAVTIFLVTLVALPLTVILLRICHKKYGKFISIAMVSVLVGLSALNLAVHHHRMALDPLTENPDEFVSRSLILAIAAVIFLVFAGILFWLHKTNHSPTATKGKNGRLDQTMKRML